jgi:hypothetical protein
VSALLHSFGLWGILSFGFSSWLAGYAYAVQRRQSRAPRRNAAVDSPILELPMDRRPDELRRSIIGK